MLKIEKGVVINNSKQETLISWINDLRNWEVLMPQDRIDNWQADENSCELNLKGLANLKLEKTESDAQSVKVHNPNAKPFEISIQIKVEEDADNSNKVSLIFEGKMNSFIKAMAEKPLSNFIEGLGQNFKEAIEGK